MEEQLGNWFEGQRQVLIERFTKAASDTQSFPGFSALKFRQLRQVVQREVDGLISFMKSDDESLQRATDDHRDQNRRFLAEISMQEQLDFLQKRVEIVEELFLGEPDYQSLQREFRRKFEMARRFYRTQSRAIDLEQRFSNFSAGDS